MDCPYHVKKLKRSRDSISAALVSMYLIKRANKSMYKKKPPPDCSRRGHPKNRFNFSHVDDSRSSHLEDFGSDSDRLFDHYHPLSCCMVSGIQLVVKNTSSIQVRFLNLKGIYTFCSLHFIYSQYFACNVINAQFSNTCFW